MISPDLLTLLFSFFLQRTQYLLEVEPLRFDRGLGRIGNVNRRANRNGNGAERLRDLRPIPAVHHPETIRFDMKRQDRLAGGAGKEHGTGLGDTGRTARAVDRERGGLPVRQVAPQLDQRARAAARGRSARGAIAEPPDDAGNPLTVEVLAGDDDTAAILPEERGRQNTPVPESEDGLLAGRDDGFVVLEALNTPSVRGTEGSNERRGRRRDQRSLPKLSARQTWLDATSLRSAARRRLRAGPSR